MEVKWISFVAEYGCTRIDNWIVDNILQIGNHGCLVYV